MCVNPILDAVGDDTQERDILKRGVAKAILTVLRVPQRL